MEIHRIAQRLIVLGNTDMAAVLAAADLLGLHLSARSIGRQQWKVIIYEGSNAIGEPMTVSQEQGKGSWPML